VRYRQQRHVSSSIKRDGHPLVIDIISTGSWERRANIPTQQETFGRHAAIRNFWTLTEVNDTDTNCATQLTMNDIHRIIDFCNATYMASSRYGHLLRQTLFRPKRNTSAGWLCAQQRPMAGLKIAMEWYRRRQDTTTLPTSALPHYLIFIDDDTYLHMDTLIATMRQHIPYTQTHLAAGCKYESLAGFAFPYGGFAAILTQPSLQQLIFRPLHCSSSNPDDPFSRLACQRLEENRVGEARFFQEGMSVADLMIQFTVQQPFTHVDAWKEDSFGFCFHSDHLLAYFLNFYHIGIPFHDRQYQSSTLQLTERQRYRHGVQPLDKCATECAHQGGDQCVSAAAPNICHTITPQQMLYLYEREKIR
jgi:hypothetical protein